MEKLQETILLVDDTPANLGMLFEYLEQAGYKVLVATSGKAAITSVKYRMPDIILLDVMMPDIDGFETCRQLKANPLAKNIPVIFMTALDGTTDEVKGFELGAVDYITKPIQMIRVLARIKTHLTLHRLQKDLEKKNAQLEEALAKIRALRGLLPICSNCKKIRDDKGYWHQVEVYVRDHSDVEFSHGICPDCMRALYPEYAKE